MQDHLNVSCGQHRFRGNLSKCCFEKLQTYLDLAKENTNSNFHIYEKNSEDIQSNNTMKRCTMQVKREKKTAITMSTGKIYKLEIPVWWCVVSTSKLEELIDNHFILTLL